MPFYLENEQQVIFSDSTDLTKIVTKERVGITKFTHWMDEEASELTYAESIHCISTTQSDLFSNFVLNLNLSLENIKIVANHKYTNYFLSLLNINRGRGASHCQCRPKPGKKVEGA